MLLHGWERGAELACGEIFQGTKASVEFAGRQAPLAVKRAQKIPRRAVTLARVAFQAAGNQVAVGIASEAHTGHDVVEAVHVSGSAAQTIKANAAFATVNGFAEGASFQEIGGLEVEGGRFFGGKGGAIAEVARGRRRVTSKAVTLGLAEGADLLGQAHLDEMAGLAAFEQAKSPQLIEAADGLAHRPAGETEIAGYGQNSKVQAGFAYDERMAQKIGVDGAVPDGQAEARGENIFKLHPEEFGI